MIDLIVGLCGTIILLFICYVLASSKYQRNWNKFTVSWYKKKGICIQHIPLIGVKPYIIANIFGFSEKNHYFYI